MCYFVVIVLKLTVSQNQVQRQSIAVEASRKPPAESWQRAGSHGLTPSFSESQGGLVV